MQELYHKIDIYNPMFIRRYYPNEYVICISNFGQKSNLKKAKHQGSKNLTGEGRKVELAKKEVGVTLQFPKVSKCNFI